MKPIFIIEHLEPKLWPWCIIEYESISKIVGSDCLWFTNIKGEKQAKLNKLGKVFSESITKFSIDMKKACVLDPLAPKQLKSSETKHFDYYIFGGILGEEKLNGRTKRELTNFLHKANKRNLGKGQFSTDNAVFVTKKVIERNNLKKIPLINNLEIKINKIESIVLPYSYPLIKNKPKISQKLLNYLKNKKGF